MNAEDRIKRASKAASVRWGERGPSVRIRVDASAARALEAIPEAERRAFASTAILRAITINKEA